MELQQLFLLAVRLGYRGTSKVTGCVLRVNAGWWGEGSSLKIQGELAGCRREVAESESQRSKN